MKSPGDAYGVLARTQEVAGVRDRHLEFFRGFACQARDKEYSIDRDAWADLLEAEIDNVRAALAWSVQEGMAEAAQDLAASCRSLWERGRYTEGRMWLGRALSLAGPVGRERVRALLVAVDLADRESPAGLAGEAEAAAREVDDPVLVADILSKVGWYHVNCNALPDALTAFEEAVAIGRAVPEAAGAQVASALLGLAWARVLGFDSTVAGADPHEEAFRLLSAPGYEGARCVHLGRHALIAFQRGDLVRAERLYDQKLAVEADPRLARTRSTTLLDLGDVKEARHDRSGARAAWTEILGLGHEENEMRALLRLAGLDMREADLESAAERLDRARAIVDATDDAADLYPYNGPLVLYLQSELAQHRGDVVEARRLLEMRVARWVRPVAHGMVLLPLARLAARRGDTAQAIALLHETLETVDREPALGTQAMYARAMLAEVSGDLDLAWETVSAAREQRRGRDLPMESVMDDLGLIGVALRRGDVETVRALAEAALPTARSLGLREEIDLLHALADAALMDGRPAEAAEHVEALLPRWPDVGGATAWVDLAETVAATAIGTGRADRGAELLALCDHERQRIVYPRRPDDLLARLGLDDAPRAAIANLDIRTALWKEAGR